MTASDFAPIYLEKAGRALNSARILLQAGETEGACNRAYYAMFDAAHAALWASGARADGEVIKTHSGLVAAFSEALVKTGAIPQQQGRALARVLKARLLGDYTAVAPDSGEAQRAVDLSEAFVGAIRAKFFI